MSKDKTAHAASVAATPSSHTAEAFASTQAAQDTIDSIEIDEVLTLRRMIVRAPTSKGPVLFLHGFPETLTVWKEIATTLAHD